MLANFCIVLPTSLPVFLGLVLLDYLLLARGNAAASLPPINWNKSNPMFKTSNFQHIIEVHLFDQIDFVCPHFPDGTPRSILEYYIIHEVSRMEYEDCNIHPDKKSVLIVSCNQPSNKKRFTLVFAPFHSIPNVPEFKQGRVYYFITTSTGTENGLGNSDRGACYHNNMKVTIRVHLETTSRVTNHISTTTTQPPPTPTTPTTPTSTATPPPSRPTAPRWSAAPPGGTRVSSTTEAATRHRKFPPKPTGRKGVDRGGEKGAEEDTTEVLTPAHHATAGGATCQRSTLRPVVTAIVLLLLAATRRLAPT